MTEPHLARITWLDATSDDAKVWRPLDLLGPRLSTVVSVGWVVYEDGDELHLAMDLADGYCATVGAIPTCLIRKRERLDVESSGCG